MSTGAQILVFVVAGLFLLLVVSLVRRGSLKDRFAVLWLAVGAGLIILAVARPALDALSDSLGIQGTTTLFLAALVFQGALILHLSVIVSRLEGQVKDSVSHIALMDRKLVEMGNDPPTGPAE